MNHSIMPQKPADAFPFVCHFVFAIIIASSYDLASDVVLYPEDPAYSSLDRFLDFLELAVAYVAIISGWIGYIRSVYKWPHRDTKYGMLRFVTDLAVLFCYFGLIEAADPVRDVFRGQFMFWILAMFVLYALSDLLKNRDHKSRSSNAPKNKELRKSQHLTLIFLAVSAGLCAFNAYAPGLWGDDDGALYMWILIMAISLMILYRSRKWKMRTPRRGRSAKRTSGPPGGGPEAKERA